MTDQVLHERFKRAAANRLANEELLARLDKKMRLSLCTTTINVPHVLHLYRACDSNVKMYVALDEKSPRPITQYPMCAPIYYGYPEGQDIWKCSALLGRNTLARRNIAFLEALNDGAEIVVSIDDDNAPINLSYFDNIAFGLDSQSEHKIEKYRYFNGLVASSKSKWFDAGQLLVPHCKHRGIPHGYHHHEYAPITNAKVGVMAGLVLGDSDVDATTRMEKQLDTHVVSELARSGVVVNQNTHTVFNTQNTAMLRELVPSWFLMPGVGRMDDIYGSLVVQRVARERELHVHFGQPYVFQQRNKHDLIKDLRAEIDGYEFVKSMAELLDHIVLTGKSVIEDTRTIYKQLRHASWIPENAVDAAFAYLDDCESLGCG